MMESIKTLAVLCAIFASTALFSQSQNFGKFSLSTGIGVVPTFMADNASVNTPPVNIRLTYQVSPAFNLSGYFGYSSSTSNSPFIISDGQQSLVNNKMSIYGLRGEMKKSISKKFDMYGGAFFGVSHSDKREFDKFTGETIVRNVDGPTPFNPEAPNSEFMYSAFVGTTYFLHKNLGVFAEVGYGISLLNTGITVRL